MRSRWSRTARRRWSRRETLGGALSGTARFRTHPQSEIIVQMIIRLRHLAAIDGCSGRHAGEFPDQAVLDAEDDVRVQVLIARGEYMRHQRLVSGRSNHEMDMGRAPGVAALRLEHFADRPVMRDRIGRRLDRPEPEPAVFIGAEPRAHRKIADLVELLNVVIAVIIRM